MKVKVNNVELYYEKYGKGRPIILLHGNQETHEIFDKLIEKLKSSYEVYAIDSRCHGKSEDTQWIRENQEEKVLLTGKLFQKPPLLQRMVILSVMERLCGKRKDITRIHVESVRKLYDHPVRKRVSLGYGMQAVRNYTNIEIFIENPRRESNGKGKKREEFIYLQDSLDLKWVADC